jgi:hypothetical protein
MTYEEYEILVDFCTTKDQQEKLDAYYKYQSNSKAAKALGINESSVRKAIKKLRLKPDSDPTTNRTTVTATSTLLDANGNIRLQWVKEKADDKIAAFKEAVEEICEDIEAREPVNLQVTSNDNDNMVFYTIGDAHIGMLSWGEETGNDHNLELAENDLITATKLLLSQSQPTSECFIVDVGDYFHADNMENKTAKSGNVLDVDGRYAKVLRVGLRIATELIELALTKHQTVHWRSAIGNHNEHSAIMMNAFIEAYFRNNSRVVVHADPNIFFYHTFGKNLIGITHGHTVKMDKLGQVMASDRPKAWGNAEYRYWYTGHIHHDRRVELPGCIAESFRTLAPKDAWHSAAGYRSGQDMKAILINKDYGEIARSTVNIRMVRDAIM